MNSLKQYWKQNKNGYIISSILAVIGGILILLFMKTINELTIAFVIIGTPIFLFVSGFLVFLLFVRKEDRRNYD
jgi:Na+-driven multidrug efflux pump